MLLWFHVAIVRLKLIYEAFIHKTHYIKFVCLEMNYVFCCALYRKTIISSVAYNAFCQKALLPLPLSTRWQQETTLDSTDMILTMRFRNEHVIYHMTCMLQLHDPKPPSAEKQSKTELNKPVVVRKLRPYSEWHKPATKTSVSSYVCTSNL